MRACLFLFFALSLGTEAARKPNVIFIFTDDQGTLDANCFGSEDLYTPAMDELADNGIRFTQAYSHTVCCPARAALLTGRYPQRSGVNSWTQGDLKSGRGINMSGNEVTIAEALRSAGYRTALFGKWHLGAARESGPTTQGFDEFFGLRGGFIDNYNHHFLHGSGFYDLYEKTKEVHARGKYFPEMMTDRALSFIEKNKDCPFFLYFALNIPHYPEQALEMFGDRYKSLPMPRRSYAAMISTTDHYIGKVLKRLNDLGLRKDTIIVFMSDNGHSTEHSQIRVDGHSSGLKKGHYYSAHGGGGNAGPYLGNKGTFFEGGIRVPAILSYPKELPKAKVKSQAVTSMDWYPTILDLCGIKKNESVSFDGKSLVPMIMDKGDKKIHDEFHWAWQNQWAVRVGDWKLIGRGSWDLKPGQKIPPGTHLGKISGEAPENKNYASEKKELLKELKDAHDRWSEMVGFSAR